MTHKSAQFGNEQQALCKRNACSFSTCMKFGPELPHLPSCIPVRILTVTDLCSFVNSPSGSHVSPTSLMFEMATSPDL